MTDSDNSLAVQITARFILLYPAVAVISSVPISVATASNYLMRQWPPVFGDPPTRFAKTCVRFILSVCPLVGAIYVSNLVSVLTYSGVVSFLVSYTLPGIVQIQSRRVCMKKLGARVDHSGNRTEGDSETTSLLSDGRLNASYGNDKRCPAETSYTTPLSHPVVVVSVLVFSGLATVATIASFALPIRQP